MKKNRQRQHAAALITELLILPDGQILVQNLTQPFAELLAQFNPDSEAIASRAAAGKRACKNHVRHLNELPN